MAKLQRPTTYFGLRIKHILLLQGLILFQLTNYTSGDSNYVRFLTTTWDGKEFSPLAEVEIPVIFSLGSTNETNDVVVNFTCRTATDKENNFFSPGVFGIMFKGDGNTYLHVEVESTGSSSVKIYKGFEKELHPEEPMQVVFEMRTTNGTWNGTIKIPVEYFPRGTNELAAYANYTEAPNNKIIVLAMNHPSDNKTILEPSPPNMHKQIFFSDIKMQTYLPKVSFDHWSPMWQRLLKVLPGGTPLHPDAEVHHEEAAPNATSAIGVHAILLLAMQILLKHRVSVS